MNKTETPKDRLLRFIEASGLSIRSFERSIDAGNAYIKQLRNKPSAKVMSKIEKAYPQLNKYWLISGVGEMIIPQSLNHSYASVDIDESTNKNNSGTINTGLCDNSDVLSRLFDQLNEKDKQIQFLSELLKTANDKINELQNKIN